MKKLQSVVIALLLCYSANIFGQTKYKILEQEQGKNKDIAYLKLETGNKLAKDKLAVTDFLKTLNKPGNGLSYRFIQQNKDNDEYITQHYQQYYQQLKVIGATYAVHIIGEDIDFVNGNFASFTNYNLIPKLSENDVVIKAKAEADKQYKNFDIKYFKSEELVICKDAFAEKNEFNLAYQVHLQAAENLIDVIYYIDAVTGKLLNKASKICYTNTTNTIAQTGYSGTQNYTNGVPVSTPNFVTDSYNGSFRLREVRQGVNIITLNNLNHVYSDVGSAVDFTDNDNNWTQTEMGNNKYALDEHFGAEKVFDYWKNIQGRNSLDNNGMQIKSYVHSFFPGFSGPDPNNAAWIPGVNTIHYGDGDGNTFNNLTAFDVCAHELGHGICQFTAGLSNSFDETGALSEGFSDIWGAVIEKWAFPNDANHTWYYIGEQVIKNYPYYLRNMSNPNLGYYPQPDTYNGTYWPYNTDPHIRSGVINYWFYLLTQGSNGNQTNDIGSIYNVTGIGITNAAKIAYTTERYLNSSADFNLARTMSIKAARDTFGCGSPEEIAVTKAWYAVGVGANYGGTMSILGSNSICTNPETYSIKNLPFGATVTWTRTPTNTTTPMPDPSDPNKVILTKTGNGLVTLSATVTSCGINYSIPSININVGNPYTLYTVGGGPYQNAVMETGEDAGPCNIQCYSPGGPTKHWSAPVAYNSTSDTWQKLWSLPANYAFWSPDINGIGLFFKAANQSVEFKRTVTGACGSNVVEYYCFGSNTTLCSGLQSPTNTSSQIINIYPNPTSINRSVTLEIISTDKLNTTDFANSTIQLVDANDNIILQKQGSKIQKENLEIPALSNGIYYVRIINEYGTKTEQIIVKN